MSVDNTATVRFQGDLDIVTSEGMKRELVGVLEGGPSTVTLDLGSVGFVDSSGLGALVAVHHFAVARGARLVVSGVPPHLQKLLVLTRLDRLLTVE